MGCKECLLLWQGTNLWFYTISFICAPDSVNTSTLILFLSCFTVFILFFLHVVDVHLMVLMFKVQLIKAMLKSKFLCVYVLTSFVFLCLYDLSLCLYDCLALFVSMTSLSLSLCLLMTCLSLVVSKTCMSLCVFSRQCRHQRFIQWERRCSWSLRHLPDPDDQSQPSWLPCHWPMDQ